ncbi:hypothetical protein CASFOL_031860 [Castilleja foliolosa]|uniref:Uncharacterized protein n=1 Tax=Castilleja foliolosa TaxID=1961234 RepID=A0ABD3C0S0_9LAMI
MAGSAGAFCTVEKIRFPDPSIVAVVVYSPGSTLGYNGNSRADEKLKNNSE